MEKSKLQILEAKCNALENVINELIHLEDLQDNKCTSAYSVILCAIAYISLVAFVSLAILEIFSVASIITKYIIVHYDIIPPGYTNKDLESAAAPIMRIALPILGFLSGYPILILMSQTFSSIHPKWGLCGRVFLAFWGVFLLIGLFFVSSSVYVDYPLKLSEEILPHEHIDFVLKYLPNKSYVELFVMTCFVVCVTLLYANKGANKAYINKYAKLKSALSKLEECDEK